MKTIQRFVQRCIGILYVPLIIMLLFPGINLKAQTPTNFSGKWEFDKAKSSPEVLESTYEGTVIRQVTQNSSAVTCWEIWKKPGEKDFRTSTEVYKLDGKEKVEKHEVGTSRQSAKWSQDKNVLTIRNLDTQKLKGVPQDFLTEDSYSLSNNGKTLTIEQHSKNPVTGEKTTRRVYNKK
jgi:hypothetical protein